ncbi:MAG: YCF48-related protein, partial [Halomonas venusta]|nr:YCF48-related protein [Halomonas venusta]
MSEPVMRRTQAGHVVGASRTPGFRHSPIAKALSLCSVLSMLMIASAPLQAASDEGSKFSIMSAKAEHSLLLDVASLGKRLVTVGDRGHILLSDDNGASWVQAKVPTKQMLTAVFFVDDSHGWAVGHDAQILASTDGGATWVKQFEDLEREDGAPFLDVWFKDRNNGFVVGAYGALLETTDGGANWVDIGERMGNEDLYHLNAIVEVKDSGLFVVGEQGVMFRSPDWGQTWETLEGPYEGSLFGALGTDEAGAL